MHPRKVVSTGQGERRAGLILVADNWQYNIVDQTISTFAKVGINTSTPTEALSVHGNLLVTGGILLCYTPGEVLLRDLLPIWRASKCLSNYSNVT